MKRAFPQKIIILVAVTTLFIVLFSFSCADEANGLFTPHYLATQYNSFISPYFDALDSSLDHSDMDDYFALSIQDVTEQTVTYANSDSTIKMIYTISKDDREHANEITFWTSKKSTYVNIPQFVFAFTVNIIKYNDPGFSDLEFYRWINGATTGKTFSCDEFTAYYTNERDQYCSCVLKRNDASSEPIADVSEANDYLTKITDSFDYSIEQWMENDQSRALLALCLLLDARDEGKCPYTDSLSYSEPLFIAKGEYEGTPEVQLICVHPVSGVNIIITRMGEKAGSSLGFWSIQQNDDLSEEQRIHAMEHFSASEEWPDGFSKINNALLLDSEKTIHEKKGDININVPFPLRNRIIFGDSKEIVKDKEVLEMKNSGGPDYWCYTGTIVGFDAEEEYAFDGDLLYQFDESGKLFDLNYMFEAKGKKQLDYIYQTLLNEMTMKYHDPLDNDIETTYPITGSAYDVYLDRKDFIENSRGGRVPLLDYKEWVVPCHDYNVKIDLLSYQNINDYSQKYFVVLSYHIFLDNELNNLIKQ